MQKGQTVFVVENNQFCKGEISWFLGNGEVQIILNDLTHNSLIVTRTYEIDLFTTFNEVTNF
ncbi:hypothetical protein SAMN05421676_108136 [Salinibacillus kushneri]|uniref:Uncharacterized protein n=1 Tax=Salinibacillus kushneri TaxID=237682 RepID=A0A1I0HCX8_9BACI|nr:hypothetical protein [Salinibacillus kushneri]SET80813.1 hypothetical protein SAMN05421676_108136 [Salinibacillus kushneri]